MCWWLHLTDDWQPEAEFEWLVGPIPVEDGVGKEVVIVYDRPDIRSNREFWTDANGRQVGFFTCVRGVVAILEQSVEGK